MPAWKPEGETVACLDQTEPAQITGGWDHIPMVVVEAVLKLVNSQVALSCGGQQANFVIFAFLSEVFDRFCYRDLAPYEWQVSASQDRIAFSRFESSSSVTGARSKSWQ